MSKTVINLKNRSQGIPVKTRCKRDRGQGQDISLGNTHWPGIGPGWSVESPSGCCGPGARADVLSVLADLGVSSFMETSEMMTNRPTIRKMSKDYEMTKFRELLDTKEDDSVSTMDWLVRQSPSREDEDVGLIGLSKLLVREGEGGKGNVCSRQTQNN